MAFLAMISYTSLELAACAHVTNVCMHWNLFTYFCESKHCLISALIEPTAQDIAITALALVILSLSAIAWHVPRWLPRHQLLCQILTAMCMQTLRMDCAYTTIAFLLPTFGKRSREEGDAASKRTVSMIPATEQTLGTPMDTKATMQNRHNSPPMQASSSAAESDAAKEHNAAGAETTMSLEAIVTELNTLSTDAARDVVTAAQLILKGKQSDVRNLCNPWGVQLTAQKRYRPMGTIKQELKMALTKRAMMLKTETEASAGGAATEHAEDGLEESCMCKPGLADGKSQLRYLRRWSSKSLKPRKPPHAWPIWNRRGSRQSVPSSTSRSEGVRRVYAAFAMRMR